MNITSDDFLLAKIREQNLYCDEASLEKGTKKIKRKFKLAGIQNDIVTESIAIYRFFVTTSNKITCNNFLTLTVKSKDWEDVQKKYKKQIEGNNSYIDIQRIEVLTQDELLMKLKDKKNQFIYVAKLSDKKFSDLKKLPFKIERLHRPLSESKTSEIVNSLISSTKEADTFLKKLGL
ncbi:hypothetical protein ACFL3C_04360 [Patescibacteria group bacterium]